MSYTIFTDGGSRGNPGPAAIGVYIKDSNGKNYSFGKYLGVATNNTAEYQAVIEAFLFLEREQKRGEVHFFLDSLLVVQQIKGVYKVKDAHLQILWHIAKNKISEWGSTVSFSHVPREQNKEADKLVNQTLDAHCI